jgi:hypothetical protein
LLPVGAGSSPRPCFQLPVFYWTRCGLDDQALVTRIFTKKRIRTTFFI